MEKNANQESDGCAIWKMARVEIHGPLSTTASGKAYLVSVTDEYSKWVEAEALVDKTAEAIAQFLLHTFTRLGLCQCILEDSPPGFKNQVIEAIRVIGKCLVENDNQWNTVFLDSLQQEEQASEKNLLLEKILASGSQWDTDLDKHLFEIRMGPLNGSEQTPFALMHGQRVRAEEPLITPGKLDGNEVNKPKKKRGPKRKPQTFKCEICNDEFDSEIYYRIHMRAHGAPSNLGEVDDELDFSDDDDDDDDESGMEGGDDKPLANGSADIKPNEVEVSSTEPARYRLRTVLRPTARSSLLSHMMSKSIQKRGGEANPPGVSPLKVNKKSEVEPRLTVNPLNYASGMVYADLLETT